MADIAAALKQAPFSQGISPQSREALAGVCRIRNLSKREFLFHEGDPGFAMFLLLEGNIQLHRDSPEGKETVIRILKPGDVFGEVVLFEREFFPVSAVALLPSEVLSIPKAEVQELLEGTAFRNDFIAMLFAKQRYLAGRVAELTAYDLEDRLRMFLVEHFGRKARFACSLSKKDVAAAIGATPESLSRLLVRLKSLDLLEWNQQEIVASEEFWAAGPDAEA
jgi:CRP-like cAMP-binding protein